MAEPSGPSSRKRCRVGGEAESGEASAVEDLKTEDSLSFSDTLMALRMMREQFPKMDKISVEPFVLRSQLYSSVKDRTKVDRELETLKKEKLVRLFKLNTGHNDHAIMFADDCNRQIGVAAGRFGKKHSDLVQVFDWFKTHVIGTNLNFGIGHDELISLLSEGGKVKEEHVSLLINAGFLTRQLVDPTMYWFSIPGIGLALKGLSQGRREVLSLLKRKKHGEIMLATLEKKRLRLSPLDMRFHLRDLIGSGHIRTVHSPSGIVVRLSND